jgi:hypothetical protein
MSAARLLSWRVGHGLALETRAGLFEILAQRDGTVFRLANNCPVDNFESNSRTAQRLDQLFAKHEAALRWLNERALDADPAAYRSQWWALTDELKGE